MFSSNNQVAELSLNASAKCITSIKGDTRHHRFLVGTCDTRSRNSQNGDNSGDGSGQTMQMQSTMMGGNPYNSPNQLYLLRYHEEMNELAVDAQMDFPSNANVGVDQNTSLSVGAVWQCSSCPFDPTLVVTNTSNTKCENRSSETVLWRMPKEALREDDLEYYSSSNHGGGGGIDSDNDDYDRNILSSSVKGLNSAEGNLVLEMVASLPDSRSSNNSKNILNGRVSDMIWNPECIPDMYESSLSHNYDYDGNYDDAIEDDAALRNDDNINSAGSSNSVGGGANFLTYEYGTSVLNTWNISTTSATAIAQINIKEQLQQLTSTSNKRMMISTPPKASWDPHNTNLIAASCGRDVCIVDLRLPSSSASIVQTLQNCHRLGVMDIDHNPNKPNVFTTCGQDGLVKFWDLRYSSGSTASSSSSVLPPSPSSKSSHEFIRQEPLKTLRGGHSHWTTSVKYNSFHDQLVLSGGTDGMVNLWRISSISSAPILDLGESNGGGNSGSSVNESHGIDSPKESFGFSHSNGEDDGGNNKNYEEEPENSNSMLLSNDEDDDDIQENGGSSNSQDIRVMKMELSEAVYDVAWSAADAWVFATAGFDGSVVLNHVPSKEKYKILL